ncbi:MAG: UbiA family prenyltransferase [Kiritimatiellia bacterium]
MRAPGGMRLRLIAHLRLARISNVPTIVSNVLAGAALAGLWEQGISGMYMPQWGSVLLIVLTMALFYTAGMYLNDYFDFRIDCRERPERPLPSGVLSRTTVLVCVCGYFAAGLVALAMVRPQALVPGVLLIGVIVLYDYWHKQNRLGHWVMALARSLVYVTTFVALAGMHVWPLIWAAVAMLFYVAGLTYIARNETRNDFRRYWPVGFLVLPVLYFCWQTAGVFLLVPVVFSVWCGWALWFVYRRTGKSIGGGIVRLIAGIALLDAMVLASGGLSLLVCMALVLFVLTRVLQRYIPGS